MQEEKKNGESQKTPPQQPSEKKQKYKKDKSVFITAKEGRAISKRNVKITKEYEKRKKRKNVPESEYVTKMKDSRNIVEFDNLHTYFFTDAGVVKAVNGVTFSIPQGSTVGVVGESGCGKSVTSFSLMQLVQAPQGQVIDGSEIRFKSTAFVEKNGKKVPIYEYETLSDGTKKILERPVFEKKGKPIFEEVQKKDKDGKPILDKDGKPVMLKVQKRSKPVCEEVQKKDKNGKPILDKDGKPVIVKVQKKGVLLYEKVQKKNKDGNLVFEKVQKVDRNGIPLFETVEKVYNVAKMPTEVMRKIRGREISMIFQEPMTSLNPIFTIGKQLDEVVLLHTPGATKESAKKRTYEILELVGMKSELIYNKFPHELSGGMRQRVVIAMALICNPKLIIADEPTTALDVTIQAQILELLRDIKDKISGSIMLITHDLGVIAEMADYVIVMYAGRVIEMGTAKDVFDNPMHPYAFGLQKSKPAVNKKVDRLYSIPGSVPNPINMPKHCYFKGRCERRMEVCEGDYPCMIDVSDTHKVACHLYSGINSAGSCKKEGKNG